MDDNAVVDPARPGGGRLAQALRVVGHPAHLRRTGLIALIVGTWLTTFNQFDVLWHGGIAPLVACKIALNYATPFVVANLGLLSRSPR